MAEKTFVFYRDDLVADATRPVLAFRSEDELYDPTGFKANLAAELGISASLVKHLMLDPLDIVDTGGTDSLNDYSVNDATQALNTPTGIVTATLELRQAAVTASIDELIADAVAASSTTSRITPEQHVAYAAYIASLRTARVTVQTSSNPEAVALPTLSLPGGTAAAPLMQQAPKLFADNSIGVRKTVIPDRSNLTPEFDFEGGDPTEFIVRGGTIDGSGNYLTSISIAPIPEFVDSARSGGKALKITIPANVEWLEVIGIPENFFSASRDLFYPFDTQWAVNYPSGGASFPYMASASFIGFSGDKSLSYPNPFAFTFETSTASGGYRSIENAMTLVSASRWATPVLRIERTDNVNFPVGTVWLIENFSTRRGINDNDISNLEVTKLRDSAVATKSGRPIIYDQSRGSFITAQVDTGGIVNGAVVRRASAQDASTRNVTAQNDSRPTSDTTIAEEVTLDLDDGNSVHITSVAHVNSGSSGTLILNNWVTYQKTGGAETDIQAFTTDWGSGGGTKPVSAQARFTPPSAGEYTIRHRVCRRSTASVTSFNFVECGLSVRQYRT